MNVEGMYSVYLRRIERNDSTLRHSTFDILRFAVWARGVSHELQCVALSIFPPTDNGPLTTDYVYLPKYSISLGNSIQSLTGTILPFWI